VHPAEHGFVVNKSRHKAWMPHQGGCVTFIQTIPK